MKGNPIYKRETMVSARSFRLTLVLLIFNGILALVALLNMYSTLVRVKLTAEVQYSSFLDLYLFVAVMEFVMVVFIMPALTAGSISGERERRTLDIMLSTKLTPAQIVVGKLMAALGTMGLLIASSLPILSLVFIYGGVSLLDMGLLLVSYMTAALFIGGLGTCCSAVFGKSVIATVVAYVLVGILVAGTYGVNWFVVYLKRMHVDAYAASAGQAADLGDSGRMVYLLLLNPMTSFLMTVLRLTGREPGWPGFGWQFGSLEGLEGWNPYGLWIGGNIMLQLAMAAILIWLAVRALTPKRRGKNRYGIDCL